ncbi:MAG: hypothetical protein HS116_24245 [Planctomycetes bacterium]|nr:hypothetical protein [Planctomycetota bacterium]
MPRGRKKGVKKAANATKGGKRGRKPIFTDEQKRVLDRMIKASLREQLRGIMRSL